MSIQSDRGYKIIYKTKPREIADEEPLRRQSTRDSDYSYSSRDNRDRERDPYDEPRSRRPLPPPRRRSSDDRFRRLEYSRAYNRDGGVIVVEGARRRSPVEYVVESARDGQVYNSRRYDEDRPSQRYRSPDRDRGGSLYHSRTAPAPAPVEDTWSRMRNGYGSAADRYPPPTAESLGSSSRGRQSRQDSDTPPPRLRSAMRGSNAGSTMDGSARTRARSVSLREPEAEIVRHEVGHQWHERPGKEARHMGKYLGHPMDDDLASETYVERIRPRRKSRSKSRSRRHHD